jgi:hypothetical protein
MSRPVADAAVRCRHARPTQLAPADGSFATLKLGCSENPCAVGLEICKEIKGCKSLLSMVGKHLFSEQTVVG